LPQLRLGKGNFEPSENNETEVSAVVFLSPREVKRMGDRRGFLTPEELARIMELQDLLIDRFVEQREAAAAGQDERVRTVEAAIDDLLHEKEEIEKWAVLGSA
jgi:hypothetical protein